MKTVKFLKDFQGKLISGLAGDTLEVTKAQADSLQIQGVAIIVDPETGEPYPVVEAAKPKSSEIAEEQVFETSDMKRFCEQLAEVVKNELNSQSLRIAALEQRVGDVLNSHSEVTVETKDEPKEPEMETKTDTPSPAETPAEKPAKEEKQRPPRDKREKADIKTK